MEKDKIVGEIIKGLSNKSIALAKDAVSKLDDKTSILKISYFVKDEDTKKSIEDLDLYNPQKLAVFFVEVGFSAVEVIVGSINEIQIDMMNDFLSKLKAIKQKIRHSMLSEDAHKRLRDYQDELIDLRNVLERRVSENIQRIVRIDNMSSFERKVKAAFIRNNVDLYTKNAQACLQAVMEIAKLQSVIADYIGDNNFSVIQCDIDEFMNDEVFSDGHISLMNDWATKENSDFWSDTIRSEYDQIIEQHTKLLELFDDIRNVAEEKKVDLEDIVFE